MVIEQVLGMGKPSIDCVCMVICSIWSGESWKECRWREAVHCEVVAARGARDVS